MTVPWHLTLFVCLHCCCWHDQSDWGGFSLVYIYFLVYIITTYNTAILKYSTSNFPIYLISFNNSLSGGWAFSFQLVLALLHHTVKYSFAVKSSTKLIFFPPPLTACMVSFFFSLVFGLLNHSVQYSAVVKSYKKVKSASLVAIRTRTSPNTSKHSIKTVQFTPQSLGEAITSVMRPADTEAPAWKLYYCMEIYNKRKKRLPRGLQSIAVLHIHTLPPC